MCFGCEQPIQVPDTRLSMRQDLAFAPGTRISDRYAIEAQIGKGGMGVVYKAEDTLVCETVALKFMRPQLLRTDRGQQLFVREAQIARRLRHENIVAVHDVSWTYEGILYLSMEYAEGVSLRAYLREHRVERRLISVRLMVEYIRQVLSALEFAHRTVVHRDMKPENVMLLQSERVKVLDFGLAKAMHAEVLQDQGSASKPKRMVGTLAYAAPEQKRLQDVDSRADIYAVGLLMYELLTLRTPLDDQVPVSRVRDDIAPSMLAVLNKALVEEKEQRWQSARDFREELEKAFDVSYVKPITQIDVDQKSGQSSTENMAYLKGGSFLMGNDDMREEAPESEVFVEPFWIDIYPVTVENYQKYLEDTGNPEPRYWRDPQYNGPDQPVVGVSWAEAQAYAEWAGKALPTEKQWEFAARGKRNRRYPWGDLPPDTTRCNYRDYLAMPSIVTMHEDGHTPDGLYDMAGNVHEWTADPFVPYSALRSRPEARGSAPRMTVRGGAWDSPEKEITCSARKGIFPESREKNIGFRCVVSAGDRGAT